MTDNLVYYPSEHDVANGPMNEEPNPVTMEEIKEDFATWKTFLIETIKADQKNTYRVDSLWDMAHTIDGFSDFTESVDGLANQCLDAGDEAFKTIMEVAEGLEFDSFVSDEYEDPFWNKVKFLEGYRFTYPYDLDELVVGRHEFYIYRSYADKINNGQRMFANKVKLAKATEENNEDTDE